MNVPKHTLALAVIAALCLPFATLAADKPDFSGGWKLNVGKSDFGQMPAPSSAASKIDHKDPNLKIATTIVGEQGEFTIEATYSTDGKETTNKFFGDNDIKSTAKWEGAILVIDSKASMNGSDMTSKEKWTLSTDGKVLTRAMTFSSAQGDGSWTQVFDKQ